MEGKEGAIWGRNTSAVIALELLNWTADIYSQRAPSRALGRVGRQARCRRRFIVAFLVFVCIFISTIIVNLNHSASDADDPHVSLENERVYELQLAVNVLCHYVDAFHRAAHNRLTKKGKPFGQTFINAPSTRCWQIYDIKNG